MPCGVREREHVVATFGVVYTVNPRQCVEVRHLPQSLHREKPERVASPWRGHEASTGGCRKTKQCRQRAANGTDMSVVRAKHLHWCVGTNVCHHRSTCNCCCCRICSSGQHTEAQRASGNGQRLRPLMTTSVQKAMAA